MGYPTKSSDTKCNVLMTLFFHSFYMQVGNCDWWKCKKLYHMGEMHTYKKRKKPKKNIILSIDGIEIRILYVYYLDRYKNVISSIFVYPL